MSSGDATGQHSDVCTQSTRLNQQIFGAIFTSSISISAIFTSDILTRSIFPLTLFSPMLSNQYPAIAMMG